MDVKRFSTGGIDTHNYTRILHLLLTLIYLGYLEHLCIPTSHIVEIFTGSKPFFGKRLMQFNNETIQNKTKHFLWNRTNCLTLEHLDLETSLPLNSLDDDVCLMQPYAFQESYGMFMLNNQDRCFLGISSWEKIDRRSFLYTSRLSYFPSTSTTSSIRPKVQLDSSITLNEPINIVNKWNCNRGIFFFSEMNKTAYCFCPPSYFGEHCEWQNQRISLTLQLIYRNFTYPIRVFQVIITLIDEQRQIFPYHEQFVYIPSHDCGLKYNIYLLYPDQPKNLSANYSIQIDIFDKITLTYWSSWHLSIPFSFLPVNRISTQLFIPSFQQFQSCSSCGNHGRCVQYTNKNFSYFCQCDRGYSGEKCDIKHTCNCSSDAFCLTSSICICPMNKFGSKCYLKHSVCQSPNNSCENNGLCVPTDDRIVSNNFTCLCEPNFNGRKCQNKIENKIDIEFEEESIKDLSFVFVHFIRALESAEP
jgi:hypothetical protein